LLHVSSGYYEGYSHVASKLQRKIETRLSQIRNQIDHFELIES